MKATVTSFAAVRAFVTKFADMDKAAKIVYVKKQISNLEVKLYNIENDIVVVSGGKKVVPMPELGAIVTFSRGRRTATTEPTDVSGVVLAIKPATVLESGKTAPAQIKVQVGEGFDAEFVVIYPAQIKEAGAPESDEQEDDESGDDEQGDDADAPAYQE